MILARLRACDCGNVDMKRMIPVATPIKENGEIAGQCLRGFWCAVCGRAVPLYEDKPLPKPHGELTS